MYGQPEKMQAKLPAVSPVAFLSYHSWKMKAICVGLEWQTAQSHKWFTSDFVKDFKNWISEKYEDCCEIHFKEGEQSDATFPSNWDIMTYDECLTHIVHRDWR